MIPIQNFGHVKLFGMKLLIVEDDAELRSLMNEFLTQDGHDVYEAQNGIEAISLIKANFFDLVISESNELFHVQHSMVSAL